MSLEQSELILNPDRSVYHLNLLPEDIAGTIILVGDPGRVPEVSRHFDSVDLVKSKREFTTHTGRLGNRHLSVVSTGIGTDNIDIVLNELDALVNIDFQTRQPRRYTTRLQFIRLGTAGAIQQNIPVDSLVISEYAVGLDGLLNFYDSDTIQETGLARRFGKYMGWPDKYPAPYAVAADPELNALLTGPDTRQGITTTNPGFYGPQGRRLRLPLRSPGFVSRMAGFRFKEFGVANMEMETAGILGMARLLGHSAASVSAILANRVTREFSAEPEKTIDALIRHTLERILTQQTPGHA